MGRHNSVDTVSEKFLGAPCSGKRSDVTVDFRRLERFFVLRSDEDLKQKIASTRLAACDKTQPGVQNWASERKSFDPKSPVGC